jgi:phage terminase small subunit
MTQPLTDLQIAYARHRIDGLKKGEAAVAAGYSPKSARVSASILDRDPRIRDLIAAFGAPSSPWGNRGGA